MFHRAVSPLPSFGAYQAALESPISSLPHTEFPNLNESGGYDAPCRPGSSSSGCFSPMPTRDHQQDIAEEQAAINNQVRDFIRRSPLFSSYATI